MKKSLCLSALLLAAAARPVLAQTVAPAVQPVANDTLQARQQLLRADSLVAAPAFSPDSARMVWAQTPPEVRDLVADRLSCYESEMPLVFNNTVMAFVNYFTVRNRRYTQRVLERQNLYFPLFEKYLAKYHLPQDLKYLAVVESALLPQARSRVGALGLWQFMGPTANDLHLRRDEFVDERMNPEKSTEAACKFLRDLHRYFGDWELALAAYNYGTGNINKAIRRAGGQRNFWAIYKFLPKETRDYVPTFTAILYSLNYAKEHGLHDGTLAYRYAEPTDTLLISGRSLDLYKFSKAVGLDSTTILAFNPELRKHYLPETFRNYPLQVPQCVRTELAVQNRTTVLDYCKVTLPPPVPLAPVVPVVPTLLAADSTQPKPVAAAPAAPTPRYRRARHTVRRGETVNSLAARYDVDPSQIRRWNKLQRGQQLTPKQQLWVYVPVQAEATTASTLAAAPVPKKLPSLKSATPELAVAAAPGTKTAVAADTVVHAIAPAEPESARPAPAIAKRPAPARMVAAAMEAKEKPAKPRPEPTSTPASEPTPAPTEYVVRKGDYLTKIAREQNLSVAQLTQWNQLKSPELTPGQRLQLRAATEAAPAASTALVAATRPRTAPAKPALRPAADKPRVHLVQPGDTLYNISRRYQGVTVDQLRKLNHLTSDEVKPGQQLIVNG